MNNKVFNFSVIIIFTAIFSYFNFQNREYDWDMPGYLGCLFETEYRGNIEKIHQKTYSSIEKEAPEKAFQKIQGKIFDNKATSKFYESPSAFYEQLPYYKIKPAYNFLIFMFYKSGFSPPLSVLLPNIFTYFLSGILLFLIFSEIFPKRNFVAALFSICILIFPPFRYLSTIASPDMLALFFMFLFIFSVIKKSPLFFQFLALLGLILARPDYIVFVLSYFGIYFLYNLFKTKKIDWKPMIFLIISGGIYMAVLKIYNYPGWDDVFYDSFIKRRPILSQESPDFTMKEYIEIILKNIINFKKITLSGLLFSGICFYFSKNIWAKIFTIFLLLNIYLKFIFFPASGEYRFFLGYLILLFIWMLYQIFKKFSKEELK